MNQRYGSILAILSFLGLVLGLIGLTFLNLWLAEILPVGNQFAPSWAGARFWIKEGVSPYDDRIGEWVNPSSLETGKDIVIPYLGITIPVEEEIPPIEFRRGFDFAQYIYPMTAMLLTVPFGLFDFPLATAIWMTLLELGVILLVLASIRLTRWQIGWLPTVLLVVFFLLWYYSIRSVLEGQISVLSALFVALSLIFILNSQDVPAGVFLTFSTITPSMVFLIVPFILLWSWSTRRRDVVWSFLITFAVTLLATIILIPSWLVQWFQRLFQFATMTPEVGSLLMEIAEAMPGIYLPVILFFHGILLVYLVVEWVLVMGKDEQWFLWTAMMTIVISNLGGYKIGITNYVLLIPVLMMIFQSLDQRWQVGGKYIIAIVMLVMGVGIWVLMVTSGEIMALPVWIYFPLPIICLVGLWWIRWWFIKPQKLYIETLSSKI